uniref:Leucine-rich repeat-containing N-terminal plant-type domain-containing protein n=1 Tax=Fagus sylvatica TaxID=28930 RepID=A0A2N9GQM7_FAGSY
MGFPKFSLSSMVLLVMVAGLLFRAESKTYWGDIEVLKELKNGLDPSSVSPGSCVTSWDFTVDPCDNLFSDRFTCGFRCDLVDSGTSRVTELSLDHAGYTGSLSSTSWNLPYLDTLDLSNNFFSGPIPDSLSNLTRLRRLGLSMNSFSGEIPTSIGSISGLEELYLDNNNLQGTIPASFNNLVSLKRLELQSNNLTGEFPELGSLKNLNFLDASNNAISGEIPATFPSSLVQISMRNNSLEVALYHPLSSMASHLFSNSLSHSTSSPPYKSQLLLGIQSELIAIDLSNNDLRGFCPSFIALMPRLSALSLENNKLTGMIPTQYALKTVVPGSGISPFARLLLGGNYLYGPIPDPLMGLKPGSVNVNLVDNCLYRCPVSFFFCQGGEQKSVTECRSFAPVIP